MLLNSYIKYTLVSFYRPYLCCEKSWKIFFHNKLGGDCFLPLKFQNKVRGDCFFPLRFWSKFRASFEVMETLDKSCFWGVTLIRYHTDCINLLSAVSVVKVLQFNITSTVMILALYINICTYGKKEVPMLFICVFVRCSGSGLKMWGLKYTSLSFMGDQGMLLPLPTPTLFKNENPFLLPLWNNKKFW